MAKSTFLVVFFVLELISSLGISGIFKVVQGQLSLDFYKGTCPGVETLVRNSMSQHFKADVAVPAHILRMQFHDCAATGCDASLLLTGTDSEQNAEQNLSVLGYDVIEDIKVQVEAFCPAVVSCADILAMAARDAVGLTQGPDFRVPLGRFDSTFSGGSGVSIPPPNTSVLNTIAFFKSIGLDDTDLVVLNGAHTIGVAHCNSFNSRLYNYNGSAGASDPSIASAFLKQMKKACPQGNTDPTKFMQLDQETINTFDNQFFSQVEAKHGVLQLDQALLTSNVTTNTMIQMALNQSLFFETFAASLVKMGQFNVSDKNTGSIRLNCSILNPPATPPIAPSPPSPPAIAPSPLNAAAELPFDAPADSPGEDLAPVAGG